jgi:GH18 family chitinase
MVLSLGSHGDWNMAALSFTAALMTERSRAEFLKQIISLVEKLKFAGVAFHWIYPGCPRDAQNVFLYICWNIVK